jgi:hypothetical protein
MLKKNLCILGFHDLESWVDDDGFCIFCRDCRKIRRLY